MSRLIFCFLVFTSTGLMAQVNYEVKVMTWNLLNFPNNSNTIADTTDRCPSYRAVVNYVQPDIVVIQEVTTFNGIPWFRDQVMNTGIYHFEAGFFINGPDTDNGIFYRDSLFDFVSNTPVSTSLRDINQFTLVFKPTGDTLHIFSLHLKASQGYELQRAGEVADLRQVTNAFNDGANFLVAGDFNIYSSYEPAYSALLQDNAIDDGNFIDPLTMTGTWNNSNYAPYHTQSTRVNSTGGFSGGGMNDRFDMILYSNGVKKPGGVYYMPGTYMNIGNDGNHFDRDVNFGTNSSVPDSVADALYNSADHLPVTLKLMIGPTADILEVDLFQFVDVFPNPVNEFSSIRFSVTSPTKVGFFLVDPLGRRTFESPVADYAPGDHLVRLEGISDLPSGFYSLSISFDNYLVNKKLILIK